MNDTFIQCVLAYDAIARLAECSPEERSRLFNALKQRFPPPRIRASGFSVLEQIIDRHSDQTPRANSGSDGETDNGVVREASAGAAETQAKAKRGRPRKNHG